ncbi:MAG: hypothetical protein AAF383_03070 [Cyanobacteria bacterium P01_A01_bin.83]
MMMCLLEPLTEGGVAWESKANFSSMDEALSALDRGIADWCEEMELEFRSKFEVK